MSTGGEPSGSVGASFWRPVARAWPPPACPSERARTPSAPERSWPDCRSARSPWILIVVIIPSFGERYLSTALLAELAD